MAGGDGATLPGDLLEAQLSMVELIRAMYPSSTEKSDSTTDEMIERLRSWCESSCPPGGSGTVPSRFSFDMTIPLDTEGAEALSPEIQISIAVPLTSTDVEMTEPPPLTYSLRQPVWMSRAELAELGSGMPAGDVLGAFDYIQENAPRYLRNASQSQREESSRPGKDAGPLMRVWFYFPSLSTREKRKDLVSYTTAYDLTGFVLAGKPGVLCLEGGSGNIDGYMNAIKNESWGDIPSHQKKVSERFREECGPEGRKGDMAALEAWLKEKGVGDSFSKVVMGA
ncbi:hypothetical protein INS49_013859 [Diaporthe citri]|uniref:uncharacterized protein n=1 Tax=Diaporthe citri TaxID=83186 RepID=UPI001C803AF5|nr:uncharacterized protein INS49_013859 [Diaporthe citri]KAG6357976.1 hypothetical protein INS49_013859 [Diaporthe citri]